MVPDVIRRTRSNSLKMSDRGWWREMSTSLLPLARRDKVFTRLWAVKLSSPEVGSSRMRIPSQRQSKAPGDRAARARQSSRLSAPGRPGLTWIPQELHPDADSPPLAPGHPAHVGVAHASVGALPQPQLRDHVLHLRAPTFAPRVQRRLPLGSGVTVSSSFLCCCAPAPILSPLWPWVGNMGTDGWADCPYRGPQSIYSNHMLDTYEDDPLGLRWLLGVLEEDSMVAAGE